MHTAAKEMVQLAEQGLGEKSTLDTACQEMLSHAASNFQIFYYHVFSPPVNQMKRFSFFLLHPYHPTHCFPVPIFFFIFDTPETNNVNRSSESITN